MPKMAISKLSQGYNARKRFGQHFLQDQSIIAQIVAAIAPQSSDIILEIGPGLGALTYSLLPLAGTYHAIELDRDVIPVLEKNCAERGTLIIHQSDALKFCLNSIIQPSQMARVVGNLPYNISTPLIFHLLEQGALIKDMYFMLQKEVVDRMAAQVGNPAYGRLSIMVQYYCAVQSLFEVGPEAFNPPPKVQSAIVRLIPYQQLPVVAQDVKLFADLVRSAFNQRRKTIHNSLKPWSAKIDWAALALNPKARAEELSVQDFAALANAITAHIALG